MNRTTHNPNGSGTAEETLRLIAKLPSPEGLEGRVHEALRRAPQTGRILAWPAARRPQSGWMRTAAAAAIVFVVAGGGWGVYSRVERGQLAKTAVLPHVPAAGGFQSAGAMRTPQTLIGPVVTHPEPGRAPGRAQQAEAAKKTAEKTKADKAAAKARSAHQAGAGKTAAQPITPPAR